MEMEETEGSMMSDHLNKCWLYGHELRHEIKPGLTCDCKTIQTEKDNHGSHV